MTTENPKPDPDSDRKMTAEASGFRFGDNLKPNPILTARKPTGGPPATAGTDQDT